MSPAVSFGRRRLVAIFLLITVSGVAGCSSKSGLYPVSGFVTVDGETLAAGSVTLHADGTRGNTSLEIGAGKIQDGEYEIFTGQDRGVAAGFYKVLVVSTNFSGDNPPPRGGTAPMPRSLINRKYGELARTPLSFEVVAEPAEGAYDLEVSK